MKKKYIEYLSYLLALNLCEVILKINLRMDIKISALIFNLILSLLLLSIANILSKSKRRIFESITLLIFMVYTIAQNIYYLFFNNLFSIVNISTVIKLNGIKIDIFSKIDINLLLYFLPPLLLFVGVSINNNENEIKRNKIIESTIIAIISLFMCTNTIYADNLLNKVNYVENYGLSSYIQQDIINCLENDEISDEELDTWYKSQLVSAEDNDYTGIFKDKNLIIVQAESLCKNAINKNITPNLAKLIDSAIYFDNFYAPLYPANTNDSEFIIQTSLMPSLENKITCYAYDKNYFPQTMATIFKQSGYNTNSYHSYFKEYYNRNIMHKTLGFDQYYALEDLFPEEIPNFKEEYWIDDKKLIEEYLKNKQDNKTYDLIITTSSHLPYSSNRTQLIDNYQKVKKIYPDMDEELAYYFASIMKFDEAIGLLVDNLSNNDVLVIVGDHYPYGLNEEALKELIQDKDYHKYQVPLIIYNKETQKETIHKSGSTFDVLPTIANLFGIKLKELYLGKDLLSQEESKIYFSNGDVLIGDDYYQNNNDETYIYCQYLLKKDYFQLKKR